MSSPTFTLCYTSIRAGVIGLVVNLWTSKAKDKSRIRWSITTDANRYDSMEEIKRVKSLLDSDKIPSVVGVVTELPGTCVKGWNTAYQNAKLDNVLGDVIIAVADDFEPPLHWDELLTHTAEQGWWMKDRVVHVSDGYNPDLFTLSILTKQRAERFGYLFYPGYESMFCDTEFTMVAIADGVVIEAKHLLFEHMHPDCGKRARDEVDLNHSSRSRWQVGEMLFNFRKSIGFPIDAGPNFDSERITARDMAVYIQATKDDFCLFEVCQRLYEEGIRDFFFYIPNEYWSGKQVTDDESNQVKDAARMLSGAYPDARVRCTVFDISKHRAPGRSRIQVETHARNEALGWVKSAGFNHIVIADGDELWRRGLLQELIDVVNDYKPTCVYTGMVPVVGLPGYPIEGAVDKASIYVSSKAEFQECRGTYGYKYELRGHRIFHFTATRRTMDEIIQKNRESGHYDDPNYDFEGWIANVLPNIRPGMRNVHMYKPYNPWKEVRHWSADEVREIPPSLYRYLAIEPAILGSKASPHVSKSFTPSGVPKASATRL